MIVQAFPQVWGFSASISLNFLPPSHLLKSKIMPIFALLVESHRSCRLSLLIFIFSLFLSMLFQNCYSLSHLFYLLYRYSPVYSPSHLLNSSFWNLVLYYGLVFRKEFIWSCIFFLILFNCLSEFSYSSLSFFNTAIWSYQLDCRFIALIQLFGE